MNNNITIRQPNMKHHTPVDGVVYIPYMDMVISLAIDGRPQTAVFKSDAYMDGEILFAVDGADISTIHQAMAFIQSSADDPMPFGQASIVTFLGEGREWLIDEVNIDGGIEYAILGHEKFGNQGSGGAWYDHATMSLVSPPTLESWRMLSEARNVREDGLNAFANGDDIDMLEDDAPERNDAEDERDRLEGLRDDPEDDDEYERSLRIAEDADMLEEQGHSPERADALARAGHTDDFAIGIPQNVQDEANEAGRAGVKKRLNRDTN